METLSFQQRYEYSRSANGIELPIQLSVDRQKSVRLLAYVDTGASFCIFQRAYAEKLGLDVESEQETYVRTATGRLTVYGHTLRLSCLEWEDETMVYFASEPEFGRNVLGRTGWLHRYRLGLIDHDALLFLGRYDD